LAERHSEERLQRELDNSLRRSQDAEAATACAASQASRADTRAEDLHAELCASWEVDAELREELQVAGELADKTWENNRRQRAAASLRLREETEECDELRAKLAQAEQAAVTVRCARDFSADTPTRCQLLRDDRSPRALSPDVSALRWEMRQANVRRKAAEDACLSEEAQCARGHAELLDARASALEARAHDRLLRDKVIELQAELHKAREEVAQAHSEADAWRHRAEEVAWANRQRDYKERPRSARNGRDKSIERVPSSPAVWPINTAVDFSFTAAAERAALLEPFRAAPLEPLFSVPPPRPSGTDVPCSSARAQSGSPQRSRSSPSLREQPRVSSRVRTLPSANNTAACRAARQHAEQATNASPSNPVQIDPMFRAFVRQYAMGQLHTDERVHGEYTECAIPRRLVKSSSGGLSSVGSSSVGRLRCFPSVIASQLNGANV